MPTASLTLPALHPGQEAVRDNPAQYRVVPCGRRWGKSRLVSALVTECAWAGGRAWWIFPSHVVARPGWQTLRDIGHQLNRQGAPVLVRETERALLFTASKGEVLIRSADDPRSLVGEGLDLAAFDECGLHLDQTWDESVRPTLLDRHGRALFVGVPKGTRGLLYTAHQKAVRGDEGWATFPASTFDNPFLPAPDLAQLRAEHDAGQIPVRYYRQEYLAEFLPADGVVFEHVLECATAPGRDEPEAGATYVFGVDWGKRNNWTAVSCFDINRREQAFISRWRGIEYVQGRGRILALAQRWRPLEIVAETNSMGDPIIEDMERENLPIRRFQTTHASKKLAIDALALAFAQKSIKIIADPVQVAELQAFEAVPLPAGDVRYQAPTSSDGGHGDTVMADAMAWSAVDSGEAVAFWGP